ncbi:MAG: hypothetical protein R2882_05840 [Gemmatimonadales bacterium]
MNETPENGAFMVAAYVICGVILLGYALSLFRRALAKPRSDETAGPR